jgi:hypothetical protein
MEHMLGGSEGQKPKDAHNALQFAVYLLGTEATEQRAFLQQNGYEVEELGEQLFDWYDRSRPATQEYLTQAQIAALDYLAGTLKWNDATFFSPQALDEHRWEVVRGAAREVLRSFGLEWGPRTFEAMIADWPNADAAGLYWRIVPPV